MTPEGIPTLADRLIGAAEEPDILAEAALQEAARHGDMEDPYLLAQLAQGWALLAVRDRLELLTRRHGDADC